MAFTDSAIREFADLLRLVRRDTVGGKIQVLVLGYQDVLASNETLA